MGHIRLNNWEISDYANLANVFGSTTNITGTAMENCKWPGIRPGIRILDTNTDSCNKSAIYQVLTYSLVLWEVPNLLQKEYFIRFLVSRWSNVSTKFHMTSFTHVSKLMLALSGEIAIKQAYTWQFVGVNNEGQLICMWLSSLCILIKINWWVNLYLANTKSLRNKPQSRYWLHFES